MGYKIVRDHNEAWAKAHGVSGTWRTSPDPVRGLARKLTEEAGEFGEALDPGELYDLADAVNELLGLLDPDGHYLAAHQEKVRVHGLFRDHIEWSPVPDST